MQLFASQLVFNLSTKNFHFAECDPRPHVSLQNAKLSTKWIPACLKPPEKKNVQVWQYDIYIYKITRLQIRMLSVHSNYHGLQNTKHKNKLPRNTPYFSGQHVPFCRGNVQGNAATNWIIRSLTASGHMANGSEQQTKRYITACINTTYAESCGRMAFVGEMALNHICGRTVSCDEESKQKPPSTHHQPNL